MLSSNLYASAIFKALIIQGFLRFWRAENLTLERPISPQRFDGVPHHCSEKDFIGWLSRSLRRASKQPA